MTKRTTIFLGIVSVLSLCLLTTGRILALEIQYPTILGHSLNDSSSFSEFVCYLFGLGTSLAFSITLIIVAFGGVYYLISFGRGKFTSEAIDWIKAGILGLLIVTCTSLIAYTINPSLTTCRVGILAAINFNPFASTPEPPIGADIVSYQEIPIGILTENLLTRTMGCYDFDSGGNPIYNNQLVKDGPTYAEHDRADCLTKIIEAGQKKAQIIASLSDEITRMMDTCSCFDKKTGKSKCEVACSKDEKGCSYSGQCPAPNPNAKNLCTGDCIKAGCKQPPGTTDCCPAGVKDQIERGPINMSVDMSTIGGSAGTSNCKSPVVTYKGLDEFRCPNPNGGGPCSNIASFVEKQIQANNKTITVIDQNNWKKLNLLQQLIYFKEKIGDNEIKKAIQRDKDVLDKAKIALGNCYSAVSYVDLLNDFEKTDTNNRVILTRKPFSDPENGSTIDVSKYCNGFNYNNSSCLKKCNDICPDASNQAIQAYGNCVGSSGQDLCIENAYGSRPCVYGNNPSMNFDSCMSSCQNDCSTGCATKYLPCSGEYNFCKSQCQSNGQCVLDNGASCLFNAKNFVNCASQTTDQGNLNHCINNSYLCKNGSEEYAGYQDCVDVSSTNCPSITNQQNCRDTTGCVWRGESADKAGCFQDSRSSFLYSNPQYQKCPNPYSSPQPGTTCYSQKNPGALCQDLCPETKKCPASSNCPTCPCDKIQQSLKFSVPNISIPDKNDKNYNAGNEGYTMSEQSISAYQMVGPQCNEYSYNDDPLTFYCQDNSWNDPNREKNTKPQGTERIIDLGKEGEIEKVIIQTTKVGQAKNTSPVQDYCRCGARFETGDPICTTGCQYNQFWVIPPPDQGGGMWDGFYYNNTPDSPSKYTTASIIDSLKSSIQIETASAESPLLAQLNFGNPNSGGGGLTIGGPSTGAGSNTTGGGKSIASGNINCSSSSRSSYSNIGGVTNASSSHTSTANCGVNVNGLSPQENTLLNYLISGKTSGIAADAASVAGSSANTNGSTTGGATGSTGGTVGGVGGTSPGQLSGNARADALAGLLGNTRGGTASGGGTGTASGGAAGTGTLSRTYSGGDNKWFKWGLSAGPNISISSDVTSSLAKSLFGNLFGNLFGSLTGSLMCGGSLCECLCNTLNTGSGSNFSSSTGGMGGGGSDGIWNWGANNDGSWDFNNPSTGSNFTVVGDKGGTNGAGGQNGVAGPIAGGNIGNGVAGGGGGSGGGYWACTCSAVPCKGSPCQQVVDYLSELWNSFRQLKLDFMTFYNEVVVEPRSDIMKELTYSRKATNDCSLVNSAYGVKARLLSCTRVEDELIAPINNGKIKYNNEEIDGYCYGKDLGNLFDQSLTDNWFCAQEWSKNSTTK
ncbi:MAG: hypothetical protein NT155_00055 [Candidatus Staskawiczbacteria bacterium]|nr:hypothetical protein [Candidatus Staskawiczbacteria bacterium]